MNTKLILAIAIVAVVGVVAATYQINNTNDLTNSYTDVEPELQVEAASSDDVASISGDSANVVTSSKNKETTKKSSSKKNSKKAKSSSSGTSPRGGSSSGTSGPNAGSQSTIDSYSVARSTGIQMGATSTRYLSSFTVDGVVYNVYGQYKNGQLIGETEINTKTGQVTGGAWIGEVNHDSGNTPDVSPDTGNTPDSGSSSDSTPDTENNNNTTDETE